MCRELCPGFLLCVLDKALRFTTVHGKGEQQQRQPYVSISFCKQSTEWTIGLSRLVGLRQRPGFFFSRLERAHAEWPVAMSAAWVSSWSFGGSGKNFPQIVKFPRSQHAILLPEAPTCGAMKSYHCRYVPVLSRRKANLPLLLAKKAGPQFGFGSNGGQHA